MAHILLIDDDDGFRRMLRRTLERAGHSVTEAGDGAQALHALRDITVDLVITDLIMPEMEGIETIRELRQSHPDLGIIAMSGGGRMTPEGYLAAAKVFGAARVLAKPFENEELFAAIEAALRR
jgi:CheY-like chemotaxis protein